MLNPSSSVFDALGDPTRRAIIDRLSRGPATVSQLAKPLEVSLAAVLQHLAVLERSELVNSRKIGRVRTCSLDATGMRAAEKWIAERRSLWERRLDRLGNVLSEGEYE